MKVGCGIRLVFSNRCGQRNLTKIMLLPNYSTRVSLHINIMDKESSMDLSARNGQLGQEPGAAPVRQSWGLI